MSLNIQTFSNQYGSNSLFKALGHPLAADKISNLIEPLKKAQKPTLYDPYGYYETLKELYPQIKDISFVKIFIQQVEDLLERPHTEIISSLPNTDTDLLFCCFFDLDQTLHTFQHLVSQAKILSLDAIRLPNKMLKFPHNYLTPLNFATNYAFFRDIDDSHLGKQHTRIITANYWSGWGAKDVKIWFRLIDKNGQKLVEWEDELPPTVNLIAIDSKDIRHRFDLPPFVGQLFIHILHPEGHDVVKYALDTYGESPAVLSCTHDANSFPSDLYAGLPAPQKKEDVILWVQNSHPTPIPQHSIGLSLMGSKEVKTLSTPIPPYGTYALNTRELFKSTEWPHQFEIHAGKHFVRPRYEILEAKVCQRIAHANVERVDLISDYTLGKLEKLIGKGYILPAPILPTGDFETICLPTPMSTCQENLPIRLMIYNSKGALIYEKNKLLLRRDDIPEFIVSKMTEQLNDSHDKYGHVEITYDPILLSNEAGNGDGWLHSLFRYRNLESQHIAETSFGAHMFNSPMVYKNEPQSYTGRPPGLSTRLFLRIGPPEYETLCHLIYPTSTTWHPTSSTCLQLFSSNGELIGETTLSIPCNGSQFFKYSEVFPKTTRELAGHSPYIIIRDKTCRLFGYHGLMSSEKTFSFDHMFGF